VQRQKEKEVSAIIKSISIPADPMALKLTLGCVREMTCSEWPYKGKSADNNTILSSHSHIRLAAMVKSSQMELNKIEMNHKT